MELNADFTARVAIDSNAPDWVPSPLAGVDRRMLDRIGGEVARATSIVRYAPGSYFTAHTHGGGEEFLVLDGIFSDEHGDFGPGSYVRNPVGSSHTPFSNDGCTIFVKLWQMDLADQTGVRIDAVNDGAWQRPPFDGAEYKLLHSFGDETVALVRLAPGAPAIHHVHDGGEELFIIEGDLYDEDGTYPAGTWLRSPPGSEHAPTTRGGCLLYAKSGHLGKLAAEGWRMPAG
ncbi:cupin domain-containing protein [Limnoraphis robusta CCNP1315]|uniref:Cupin domain-containing protein n=2 Tax=Limnoraphis TaxID=1332112 RepID=A0ABU5U1U4_9CYAN|nr:cupin domain-containing protein [Limnoraphis robusta]MEA5520851.1 cupin domain-containing protein [Limnoraphis robusta CCNP1315]